MSVQTANVDRVAYVYSQALYEAAKEAGVLAQVEEELLAIAEFTEKDPQLRGRFFSSPVISAKVKQEVFRQVFEGRIHPMLLNFILIATKNSRSMAMIRRCLHYFRDMCNQWEGIAELELASARKFEAPEMERLEKVMTNVLGRKVTIQETVDRDLLGGFVLTHQNMVWDTSVRSRLRRFRERLMAGKDLFLARITEEETSS